MAIAWWFDTGIHFKMASDTSREYGSQANYWERPMIRENIPLGFSHVAPTALIYGVATFLSITAFAFEIFKSFSRKNSRKQKEKKQKQLNRAKDKLKWRTLSRLLQCVSGFKHFEHNLQRCMSDPELASRVRDNDSLFSDKYTQHSI